jgi:hypothetical protein
MREKQRLLDRREHARGVVNLGRATARHFRWSATQLRASTRANLCSCAIQPPMRFGSVVSYEELRISLLMLENDEARISERRSVQIPTMRAKAPLSGKGTQPISTRLSAAWVRPRRVGQEALLPQEA